MRGTCSEGFALSASGSAEQILPVSYDKIHAQTMMPFAHLAWSGAWAGIAAAATGSGLAGLGAAGSAIGIAVGAVLLYAGFVTPAHIPRSFWPKMAHR